MYSLQTCKVLLLPYWYVVSSEELPTSEALLSNGVDYSLQWTLICFRCFLSWAASSAGCASGSADLRKGKNWWAAAAGRGVRKCEEVALQPPRSAQKEGRRCSRHGAGICRTNAQCSMAGTPRVRTFTWPPLKKLAWFNVCSKNLKC